MKKGISNIWLVLVSCLVIVATASATIITVEVTGVVDGVGTHGGLALDGSVGIGSIMTGSATYYTDTPDQILTEFVGRYELISISMTVGNYIFTHDPMSSTSPFFDVSPPDIYVVRSLDPRFDGTVYIDGSPKTFDEVNFDPFGLTLMYLVGPDSITTDELPSSFPDISTFTTREFAVGVDSPPDEPGFAIWGEVTSLTTAPEPATTYYVDGDAVGLNDGSSWETAFNYLQDALAVAVSGDEIWVAEGIYKPDEDTDHPDGTGDREATFQLINGVAIYGGYAGFGGGGFGGGGFGQPDPNERDIEFYETMLSGDLNRDDGPGEWENNGENSYHVVTGSWTDQTAVLDGFTIKAGNANGSYPNYFGGGMYNYGGSPTVGNCTFSGNKGRVGGGMFNWQSSSPTVTNCIFSGNLAATNFGDGGGMHNENSSPTVTNCIFRDNTADALGGGMNNYLSSPKVTGCFFEKNNANFGGGMRNRISSATVVNCVFSENFAGWAGGAGGGMHNSDDDAKIINCIFSGNHSDNAGGGMSNYFSSSTVINCTFSRNSATIIGGGILNDYSSYMSLTNCILWGNQAPTGTGPEIYNYISNPTVSYCDIEGRLNGIKCDGDDSIDGGGNIAEDPLFIDSNGLDGIPGTEDDDLHLLAGSPCINTGEPSGDYTGQTDIDGDQRVINGRVDMGADEFRGPIYVDNDAPEDPEPNNPDISDSNENGSFAHPFDAIQEAIDVASNGETVVVLDGTYTGEGNRDIDFLGKAITVRSTDPNNPTIILATIVDCNGTEGNPHRGFYFHSQEDSNSLLDGLTITNGYAPIENLYGYDQSIGGAILCYKSSPTISNCYLTKNVAGGIWASGGAISCRDSNSIIIRCTITNNLIRSDWGDGAGISCQYSSPTISNCIIAGNRIKLTPSTTEDGLGAGIYCYAYSNPTISNCVITGNLIYNQGWGGGIFCSYQVNLVIRNCTFLDNMATRGGALHCDEMTNTSVVNCILWGDNATYGHEISMTTVDWGSMLSISFSNVKGGQADIYDTDVLNWGPGNTNVDPCFVQRGYWDANGTPVDTNDDFWVDGDYHLLVGSPCIDAGDNWAVPPDTTDLDGDGNTTEPIPWDLDGNPRIVDGNDDGNSVVDMGAYEYEAMVSCFGVNHVKLETKAGKKGNKVELKGTFSPALPIDFARDDVIYIIDDEQGHMLGFIIPAGSFEPEGEPEKQKFKFDSLKHSQPDIKAKFDFLKCKFELKVKGIMDTSEITGETLAIVLQAGENPANLVEEVVQVEVKPKHLEYKREPKLSCCPKCKGIALLEVTSTDPFTGDEYVLVFEPEPGKEKLKRKTVVDDGVNGRVKIDTSCSKPLEVGDVFGAYTVTDLIKIFDNDE